MAEGKKLGRELTESEINKINLRQEGYTLSPLEQILFALVVANKRGEHVWYKWWNKDIGDDGILSSEGLETIDDAYLKYMGCTYHEAVEKVKASIRKREEDKRAERQYVEEHKEELINVGKRLFNDDVEKVAEWERRVLAAVKNNISFFILMQAAKVIEAIQTDSTLNNGLALLREYESAASGASYAALKSVVCQFSPELGAKLYGLYESELQSAQNGTKKV